jgi:uncharacterized membrane protein YebE (DUF533 family)
MRKRLMRMLLLAAVGVVGRQIQKKFQQQEAPVAHRHGADASPTAAPFEAHTSGDSVTYEPDDPAARDPSDPNEPFSGRALR